MDMLKAVLITNIAAIAVAVLTGLVLAWQNSGSRNLALAVGTFIAATVLFGVQLGFELQTSTNEDWIHGQFTVDRATPSIRQWKYDAGLTSRPGIEVSASNWLAQNHPSAFSEDREKLTSDFAIFSLLSFFVAEESDWQVRRMRFVGPSFEEMRSHGLSKSGDCTILNELNMRTRLKDAKNVFADAPFPPNPAICLPPASILKISPTELVISNPVCKISWRWESSQSVHFNRPPDPNDLPQLPSGGGAQFETRLFNWHVETTYFALRSQSRDIAKYRDWVSRIIADAHTWFGGQPASALP